MVVMAVGHRWNMPILSLKADLSLANKMGVGVAG